MMDGWFRPLTLKEMECSVVGNGMQYEMEFRGRTPLLFAVIEARDGKYEMTLRILMERIDSWVCS